MNACMPDRLRSSATPLPDDYPNGIAKIGIILIPPNFDPNLDTL